MAAGVLLISGDEQLAELLGDGLTLAGGERLRRVAGEAEALAALAGDDPVEAVCVGPDVEQPLALVQRLHAVDRELSALIVATPQRQPEIDRERLFTPFLGPDVACRSVDDAPILGAELSDLAVRTRERRDHKATMEALTARADVRERPHPLSGRHFARVLDRAPVGAVTLDERGRIRGFNRRADELLGGDHRPIETPFVELFPAADRERLSRHLAASEHDDAPGVEVFERAGPDGSAQFLELSATRAADDRGAETIVALQDVTRRVLAERRQRTLERELDISRGLLEAVVGGSADALFVKDRDGRYLLINQAGAGALGLDASQVVGRHDHEVMPEEAARRIREDDLRVIESRVAHTFEESISDDVTFLATKAPYFSGEGEVLGVVGTARDISARKRAEDHSSFLNRAAEVLMSLDPEATLRGVAELPVPDIADFCVVSLLGPERRPLAPVFAHATPEGQRVLEQALGARRNGTVPGAAALASGRGILHERVTDETLSALATTPEQHQLLRRLDVGSAIVVPLPGSGGAMGTMLLARRTPRRGYDRDDLRFAEELARRAAVSIDNARVHAERTRVAMILQRSLLPTALAAVPGGELAVRFHAAGQGVDVGGDFYDAFEAPGGVALAIGDVCGKGPGAAAVTALARHTIRAIAMDEPRPDRILGRLNEALLRQSDAADLATAALLHVTPAAAGLELELASGGHPLPLILRRDGSGHQFGEHGTILGAVERPELPLARARLEPGDACVLYTDGLNEAAAPRLLTPENLLTLLRPAAGRGAQALADRLDVIPTAAGERMRDDTAIVVLAVPSDDR